VPRNGVDAKKDRWNLIVTISPPSGPMRQTVLFQTVGILKSAELVRLCLPKTRSGKLRRFRQASTTDVEGVLLKFR
jgi:hypothetical protein